MGLATSVMPVMMKGVSMKRVHKSCSRRSACRQVRSGAVRKKISPRRHVLSGAGPRCKSLLSHPRKSMDRCSPNPRLNRSWPHARETLRVQSRPDEAQDQQSPHCSNVTHGTYAEDSVFIVRQRDRKRHSTDRYKQTSPTERQT